MGKRLARARAEASLSQAEAAARLQDLVRRSSGSAASEKVYQSYIAKCELGVRRVDGWELLEFAAIYATTVQDLLRPLSTEELAEQRAMQRAAQESAEREAAYERRQR